MPEFDALDRRLPINQSCLLEASAGTGKTFAISHLFIRFLLSGIPIDRILVMTFTRAASKELKVRLRNTLNEAIAQIDAPSWDYTLAIENSERAQARQKLAAAAAAFDEANILTIHSFCFQILREYALETKLALDHLEEGASLSALKSIVKDYLRTELTPEKVSIKQMELLFRHYRQQEHAFLSDLVRIAARKLPIHKSLSYIEMQDKIKNEIVRLKRIFSVKPPLLYEDLCQCATQYRSCCNKGKEVKETVREAIQDLCACFEGHAVDLTGSLLLTMAESNKLKKAAPLSLHYPGLLEEMQKNLFTLIRPLSDWLEIFAQIAEGARCHIEKVIKKEELLFFDDLLHLVKNHLHEESFAQKVRGRYQAALVDEFQDTDKVQWEIFSRLFLSEAYSGSLFLIGDPKQSIYRFRSADIYTYLQARTALPVYSLECNYRSDPQLVSALNFLFRARKRITSQLGLCETKSNRSEYGSCPNEERQSQIGKGGEEDRLGESAASPNREVILSRALGPAENLFYMPRLSASLPCPEVRAGGASFSFPDGKKGCHFFQGTTEEDLFNFIAQEAAGLARENLVSFSQCAVLVKDRYQASRFKDFCMQRSVPAVSWKSREISDTLAYQTLQEILEALLNPGDASSLLRVMGGAVFGVPHDQMKGRLEGILQEFDGYRHLFEHEGILPCFKRIFQKQGECIVSQPTGEELLSDLWQMVELMAASISFPDECLPFLQNLKEKESDMTKTRPLAAEGIRILTIHTSKGLEFDVVFPLGLIASAERTRELILSGHRQEWVPSDHPEEFYQEELDAEKMRQLYVAMTRAKKRLYVPVLEAMEEAAPMSIFLKKRFNRMPFYEELPPSLFSFSLCEKMPAAIAPQAHAWKLALPKQPVLDFKPSDIHSFSALARVFHQHSSQSGQTVLSEAEENPEGRVKLTLPRDALKADDETDGLSGRMVGEQSRLAHPHPRDFDSPEEGELPAGIETGNLLHTILEKIPFHTFASVNEISTWIRPFLENHPLQQWRENIAGMIDRTLHCRLPAPEGSFSLASLDPSKVFREMEFLYPANELGGFMKGYIDQFFEHHGTYYLIDWKTNYLGKTPEAYTPSCLENAMEAFQYHQQSEIYRNALLRYLDLFGKKKAFGGCFYIFMRGVGPDGQTGIYFRK